MSNTPILSGIRDNHLRGSVGEFLLENIKAESDLSVVSAFFTIYAYEALKGCLDNIKSMRFLFGEPRFLGSLDPDKTERKHFIIKDNGLNLANCLQQKQIAKDCANWILNKVSIRSVKQTNFLHGKMYHIRNGETDHAIIGSSNFTSHGLGLSSGNNNIELNLIVDGNRDRTDLKIWFDQLWEDTTLVKDVKEDVLQYLSQLYQNHSPEFIYYKTLFHIFEKFREGLGKSKDCILRTSLLETEVWKTLFDFQKDGVKGAINKILYHNGCILADSVGLGKTYSALAVIKFFELKNERVLVLCPKKLRENWTVYRNNDSLNPFLNDRFRFDVLSHTDLSREGGLSGDVNLSTLNWGNYDLVVIDESHNFRNNTPNKKDEDGNIIRKSRYQRLLEDIIQNGIRTKVLLLSATPVNNDLKDLRNQINIISAGKEDAFKETLGIPSIYESLRQAQGHFSNWAKQSESNRKTYELLVKLGSDFFKLLDELTIARSRKHIAKYYKNDLQKWGGFPERSKPIAISPEIDSAGRFMSYDKLSKEIEGYKLSLFNPSRYLRSDLSEDLKKEYERKVGNFTQSQREDFLIGMMKVNFLKRLESSVHSFALTMERTIKKIEKIENLIKEFKQYQQSNPNIDLDDYTRDYDEDEEMQVRWEVGEKLTFRLNDLDIDKWLEDLKHDKQQLNTLYLQAKDVSPERDAKLKELKKIIKTKVSNPTKTKDDQPNRKVLLFTAFADTAEYLYKYLSDWALTRFKINSALVIGSGNNKTTFLPKGFQKLTEFNHILTNFSPISKNRKNISSLPQEGEIDLLIATDCISEGQNLQDCDCLINYDIHWNPVRIIQRFGRIDRINSNNHMVYLTNFWPTQNLDNYIKLKHRVEARMALVDISSTFEGNILKPEDLEELIKDDLRYRDRQLKRLKEEILDIEDLEDNINLTEFSLDEFRMELIRYIEANKALLEEAPFGLYTIVPSFNDIVSTISPGVIFCLKQKNIKNETRSADTEQINPLSPYFLVYILADGNVRLGYIHPKQILSLYRQLCITKTMPYDALCSIFDKETENGKNMEQYGQLLEKSINSIAHTIRKKIASGLQNNRSFVIPKEEEQAGKTGDFELVTWLVIIQS